MSRGGHKTICIVDRHSGLVGLEISVSSFLIELIIAMFTRDKDIFLISAIVQMSVVSLLLLGYMYFKRYNQNPINMTVIGMLLLFEMLIYSLVRVGGNHDMLILCMLIAAEFELIYTSIIYEIPDGRHLDNREKHLEQIVDDMTAHMESENKYNAFLQDFCNTSIVEIGNIKQMLQESDTDGAKKISDDIREVVETKIDESVERISRKKYSDNPVVDSILIRTDKVCSRDNITFTANLEKYSDYGIEDLILSSILYNMLENAYNYCKFYNDKKTFVEITITRKGDYTSFIVRNSYYGSDRKWKKSDSGIDKRHGYGQLILDDIARRYNGEFKTITKKGVYSASMIIMGDLLEKE